MKAAAGDGHKGFPRRAGKSAHHSEERWARLVSTSQLKFHQKGLPSDRSAQALKNAMVMMEPSFVSSSG